ncbi:uncharacterized protein LOC108632963 [Ceratina calcarata]|uniref:Uncharacterized protein LOC108632963 n=1 Tax=Ceratina calcarata TaxID=156304 RepID=A0AAJ7RX47_9HYME|nr:uncharacterized protein LOC108632963 [Ceratina calcarata]
MFILTFLSIVLILSRGKARRVVDGVNVDGGNWDPFLFVSKDLDESPNYDITRWVQQLHLQQCAFVEIGERFCALFVELRSIPSETKVLDSSGVGEFFLGICPCLTLHSWDLCSPELTRLRKADCTFKEATPYSNTSARVHRRLCDVTLLIENAPRCNCSIPLAGQGLYKMKGFPTCFLNPLPESLCSPRGVCGIAQCTATTLKGIHTPQCASNCHQRQPFCEELGPSTSMPADMNSLWSRWSSPKCNTSCGKGFLVALASCQDQKKVSYRLHRARIVLVRQCSFEEVPLNSLTVMKHVNFSSCPDNFGKCYCEVNTVDGIMKAARFTEPCISTEGCTSSNSGTFTFEGELDLSNSVDLSEAYENDDRERFEDMLCYSETVRGARRQLLQVYDADQEEDYGLRENRLANKKFRGARRYQHVQKNRLNNEANVGQDEDEDEDDDEDEGNDEDESSVSDDRPDEDEDDEDEEEKDEMIRLRGSAMGRQSPRNHIREARLDHSTIAIEGTPEVDEPERKGSMKIRAVTEECEDDSTERLQYYDYYESGRSTSFDLRIGLVLNLTAMSILFWIIEY